LGTVNMDGTVVEGYAFVYYDEPLRKPDGICGYGKPSGCNYDGICQGWEDPSCPDCAGGGNGGDDSKCYGFLARGAKWKTIEPWVVNTANEEGLSGAFVFSNLESNIAKWENAAGVEILGNGQTTTRTLVADWDSPDGENEVYFGDVAEPGAIAITIVWGIFGGPPFQRELIEWDQVYDQVDYDWSDSGEAGEMDFENIATHELGHSVGLDDLYDAKCSEQTMYGYADYGETKKRTLEAGDIAGIRALYK